MLILKKYLMLYIYFLIYFGQEWCKKNHVSYNMFEKSLESKIQVKKSWNICTKLNKFLNR